MQKQQGFTVSIDSLGPLRKSLTSQGRSYNTRRAYEADAKLLITLLLRDILGRPDLTFLQIQRENLSAEVTQADAEFIAAVFLNEEAMDPTKFASCRRHLSGFKRWMISVGMDAPLKDYNLPAAPTARPHPVEGGEETIDEMIKRADNHNEKEAVVAFCGYMAFRISEARAVRPEQLDLESWELKMRGKGGQVERYPIPRKARRPLFMAAMTAQAEGRETIISAADRTVRLWWSQLLEEALQRPTRRDGSEGTHAGRHAVGTDTYNDSKDLLLTAKVLRQKDPRNTVMYVDVEQSAIRDALENRGRRSA